LQDVFGTVFVREDFAPAHVESLKDSSTAVDAMVEAGWDAAEYVTNGAAAVP
jgi:hypothetical protein